MGFLSPWFLAAAGLVGFPIYLHLLRRHRAEAQPFSSLMFFERRTQSSMKHRRLRHLWLLSLRIAMLLLLAMAFAAPYIERSTAGLKGNKLLLLVVDNSFSMRAGSRLADARRAALSVLKSRNLGARAQVMTLGSQLRALTQQTDETSELGAAIASIAPGDSRASFGELARGLRSLAETAHSPVELHLFSDFQKSKLPASFEELALPRNVTLVAHRVVTEAVPNWSIQNVTAPGQVWDPKRARVQAIVAGFHTPAASRAVTLVVNGRGVSTKTVALAANGRSTVNFESLDVPYGFSRCEVKIDSADSLSADDSFLFSVERLDPKRVLFIHEVNDSRSPLYFRAALISAADAAFDVESATTEQAANLQPSQYAFVVLSDIRSLPPAYEARLVNYVRNGGSVLIAVGTSAAWRPRIPIFGGNILSARNYSRSGQRYVTVGETDSTYPSVAKSGRWAGVEFYFAVAAEAANSRVAARLADGTPLLMEKKFNEGRVVLFASGLDNLTNDFPLHSTFVPFVEQTALYLSGMEQRNGWRAVDSYYDLRSGIEHAASVEVVDPEGRRPLSLQEAATAQTFRLSRRGFYDMQLANGRHEVVGVNADRQESDLAVIPEDVLALWRGTAVSRAPAATREVTAQEQVKPYSYWWYFMLAVLATAVAESLVSDRYLGQLREEP